MNNRRLFGAVGVAGSVLAATLVAASPASASVQESCSITGADGTVQVNSWSRDRMSLDLIVKDTLADGHHVQIRLVTLTYSGTTHYWPWHANYAGAGMTRVVSTTAEDDDGIFDFGLQVARAEGSTILNECSRLPRV